MTAEELDQRLLTVVKEPTVKVGKDKKSTYVSMLAEFNGQEEWYYIDKECPQWEEYHEGDRVNARVKDWGTGRSVKAMQVVEAADGAASSSPNTPPSPSSPRPAKTAEFRTPDQILHCCACEVAVQMHPDNVDKLLADEKPIYYRMKYGLPAIEEMADVAAARLDADPNDVEFPEFSQ